MEDLSSASGGTRDITTSGSGGGSDEDDDDHDDEKVKDRETSGQNNEGFVVVTSFLSFSFSGISLQR